jgi:hypothetical protein
MDQCCAFGNKLVLMRFDGNVVESSEIVPIALKNSPLFLVIVDLKSSKDTKAILNGLSAGYPFPKSPVHEDIHLLLGAKNEEIMDQVLKALQDINLGARRIGELMSEAQFNFDQLAIPACPDQLRAPKLHEILHFSGIRDLVWGGKGVGSQGDGSAQFVCRDESSQDKLVELLETNFDVSCLKLKLGL